MAPNGCNGFTSVFWNFSSKLSSFPSSWNLLLSCSSLSESPSVCASEGKRSLRSTYPSEGKWPEIFYYINYLNNYSNICRSGRYSFIHSWSEKCEQFSTLTQSFWIQDISVYDRWCDVPRYFMLVTVTRYNFCVTLGKELRYSNSVT